MSISFIALNRMMEKRSTEDEEFQRLVKRNGKCTLADGRSLSDELLLEKLRSLGVTEASREWLDNFSRKCPSAQELATAITKHSGLEIPDKQVDWVWISLVCLWERWFPDRPNFEMLDDEMQEGYDTYDRNEPLETARLWLLAWRDIQYLMQTFAIPTIEEFDDCFGGTQSVSTWVQDFSNALNWAAGKEPSLAQERIALCRAVLDLCEKSTRDTARIHSFRRDLAESLADLGEYATAEGLYTQWMLDDPCWGGGWIGWADIYSLFAPNDKKDPSKAEQILKKALTVPNVERRNHVVDRLANLYEETGRVEEADRLREQQIDNREKAELRKNPKMQETGDDGNDVDLLHEYLDSSTTIRNTRAKVGRNDPCPCGSGRKYKKCCAAK